MLSSVASQPIHHIVRLCAGVKPNLADASPFFPRLSAVCALGTLSVEQHSTACSSHLSVVAVRVLRGVCVRANCFDNAPANHRSLHQYHVGDVDIFLIEFLKGDSERLLICHRGLKVTLSISSADCDQFGLALLAATVA
jgi:hypothetical protein